MCVIKIVIVNKQLHYFNTVCVKMHVGERWMLWIMFCVSVLVEVHLGNEPDFNRLDPRL